MIKKSSSAKRCFFLFIFSFYVIILPLFSSPPLNLYSFFLIKRKRRPARPRRCPADSTRVKIAASASVVRKILAPEYFVLCGGRHFSGPIGSLLADVDPEYRSNVSGNYLMIKTCCRPAQSGRPKSSHQCLTRDSVHRTTGSSMRSVRFADSLRDEVNAMAYPRLRSVYPGRTATAARAKCSKRRPRYRRTC